LYADTQTDRQTDRYVKVNDVFSNWTELVGGMPQGSWLRPLIFLLLIDDLQKFVDDTTFKYFVRAPGQRGPHQ